MTNNPTTASIPVTLSDGSIIIVSPLTVKDLTSLYQSARMRFLQELLRAIPKDIPSAFRREMIAEAYETSQKMEVGGDEFFENFENVAQAVYLATRKETVGMTPEKAEKILENMDNWDALVVAISSEPETETDRKTSETEEESEDAEKKTS